MTYFGFILKILKGSALIHVIIHYMIIYVKCIRHCLLRYRSIAVDLKGFDDLRLKSISDKLISSWT